MNIAGNNIDTLGLQNRDLGNLPIQSLETLVGVKGSEATMLATQSIAKAEKSGDWREKDQSKTLLDLLYVIRDLSERYPDQRWEEGVVEEDPEQPILFDVEG